MMTNVLRAATALCLVLALAGCDSVKQSLGLYKQSPDEYTVVQGPTLVMPPDYSLRPPMNPSNKPATPSVQAQAKQNVFQLNGGSAGQIAPAGNALTPGENALLAQAGATHANDSIRAQVDQETAAMPQTSQSFADKVLFWKSPTAPDETLDAAAEQKRLAENAALGKPVTAGETPTIQRTNRTIFNTLF
jgi:hypothetical protein